MKYISYMYSELDKADLIADLYNAKIIRLSINTNQGKLLTKSWDRYDSFKRDYADNKPIKGLVKSFYWMFFEIAISILFKKLRKINKLYYIVGKTVFPVVFEKCDNDYYIWFCKRPKDRGKRFNTIKFLADKGNSDAECSLGILYIDGDGTKIDYTEAKVWLERAALKEHAEAQYGLGWLYGNGKGVVRNFSQALFWLNKAANNGHKKASEAVLALKSD